MSSPFRVYGARMCASGSLNPVSKGLIGRVFDPVPILFKVGDDLSQFGNYNFPLPFCLGQPGTRSGQIALGSGHFPLALPDFIF